LKAFYVASTNSKHFFSCAVFHHVNVGLQSRAAAFALKELVVVVAVIGVLAVLLLAMSLRARNKSLNAQCISNLKHLGSVLQMFAADHQTYPLLVNNFKSGKYPEHRGGWSDALLKKGFPPMPPREAQEFLQKGVWDCPAAFKPESFGPSRGYSDYAYNAVGMSANTDTNSLGLGGQKIWISGSWPDPPVPAAEVVNPAEMMAMADSFRGGNGVIRDGLFIFGRTHDVKDFEDSTPRSQHRHQGKANVVFCDGHVESPTLNFLFEDTSDAALARWNRDHLPHREKLFP
jgi:prepilin-type processing-associated H-X9-DG protein